MTSWSGRGTPTRRPQREEWAGLDVPLQPLALVAADAELVVNATNGGASLSALGEVGSDHLAGKVLLDVANPLDFSQGFPPTLSVKDTDSLAEQIQRAFPDARVVKALNTMNASVMVDPGSVGDGDTTVFAASDDAGGATGGGRAAARARLGGHRRARRAAATRAAWRCGCRSGCG